MSDDVVGYGFLSLLIAVIISTGVAYDLETGLKSRLPTTRPYKWGFFVGCMGVSCAPVALLVLVYLPFFAKDAETFLGGVALALWCLLHAICGFYIIKRKRWAWFIGTVLSCNIFAWLINGCYASRRWSEFTTEARNRGSSSPQASPILSSMPVPSPMDIQCPPSNFPPAVPNAPSTLYYLAIRGHREGPFTLGQIRTMWASGKVPADAYYWQQGLITWYPLVELLETTGT